MQYSHTRNIHINYYYYVTTGCVQPRACGFNTGVTGNALDDDQFFVGIIDEVRIIMYNYK